MKPEYKMLIKVIVIVLAVPLFLNAVCTWGIIFDYDGGFESSRTMIFEDIFTDNDIGFALVSLGGVRIGENIHNPIVIIPLVFSVYGTEPPPYDIRFTIRDNTERFLNMK